MSTVGLSPSAVPSASVSDRPPPSVIVSPTSQPNLGTPPPPATPSAPPPASGLSPPPAVITAPPPATPPVSNQSPPPPVEAPPPRKTTSSPPPPSSKVLAPTPSSSPPSVATPSEPPTSSAPPPSSPIIPPPSPPTALPPSVPPPAPEPPTSSSPPPPTVPPPAPGPPTRSPPPPPSTPPTTSPPLPPLNPPTHSPPPKFGPHGSPPPPRKSPPITSPPPPPPLTPPTESPPSNSPPPPPENITPSKSPPSPVSTPPPSQQSPSPTNSSTNTSSPLPIPLVPPPHSDISPPYSKFSPNAPAKSNSADNNGTNTAVAAGVGAGLGMCLIILMVWCVVKCKRKKEASLNGRYVTPSPYGSSPRTDSTLKINSSAPLIQSGSESGFEYSQRELGGHSRSWFSYVELAVATNGFSPDNLLGEGGFGYVYKGYLPDGRAIAVKQLKIGSGQGEREFKAEVEIISRIHHRHLVSLVGYCVADSRRLLVYEYVPNNTLYFHLHGEGRPPMDWATRVKVAAGAARGLAYLHEDCHPRVIHRDIKSSNILLNENFDARVSDFGLAKLALDANTHVTTRVMGTFGYMAPEYASSGKLTEKSDVYSFGVVLLELITGRKPVDSSQPLGDESLVEWARPLLSHAIETAEFGALADPRLENNYVDAEMFRMIEAAAACVRHSAAKRPGMGQVVRAFDSILPSDITNGMQMGQSEIYNSAEQSAEIRLFRKMAFGSQNYSTDYFSSDNSQVHGENNQLVQIERIPFDLHNENPHIVERDLESNNQITKQDSHIGL